MSDEAAELMRYIDDAKRAAGNERVSGEPLDQFITRILEELEELRELRARVTVPMHWPVVLDLHSAVPTHPYDHTPTWLGSMGAVDDADLDDRLAFVAVSFPNVHYVDSSDLRRRWKRDPNDSAKLVEVPSLPPPGHQCPCHRNH